MEQPASSEHPAPRGSGWSAASYRQHGWGAAFVAVVATIIAAFDSAFAAIVFYVLASGLVFRAAYEHAAYLQLTTTQQRAVPFQLKPPRSIAAIWMDGAEHWKRNLLIGAAFQGIMVGLMLVARAQDLSPGGRAALVFGWGGAYIPMARSGYGYRVRSSESAAGPARWLLLREDLRDR